LPILSKTLKNSDNITAFGILYLISFLSFLVFLLKIFSSPSLFAKEYQFVKYLLEIVLIALSDQ